MRRKRVRMKNGNIPGRRGEGREIFADHPTAMADGITDVDEGWL